MTKSQKKMPKKLSGLADSFEKLDGSLIYFFLKYLEFLGFHVDFFFQIAPTGGYYINQRP